MVDVFNFTERMAKVRKNTPDNARVSVWVQRLEAQRVDRSGFEAAVDQLDADSTLTSADVIAIAHGYNRGGRKPTSRAAALALIRKRFVEILRFQAKNRVAEKVRPW